MKALLAAVLLIAPIVSRAEPPTKTSGGRFQLIQLSSMRRDQFLLDTQTGKIWSKACYVKTTADVADCDMHAWMLESVEGITGSRDAIIRQAIEIEKMKTAPKEKAGE